jgi:NAD(P)-dependent dehydrogenase (short-subunit alcohol dehydrogenase family)
MTSPITSPVAQWLDYEPAPGRFDRRVILVTGATAGSGRAVATALVRLGASVILHGRSERKLEQLYQELSTLGPEPSCAVLDLQKAQGDAYQQLIDAIENRYGRLDALLHNAALLGDRSPIEHYDIATWQRVMHVNVNATFILTRCLLPLLKASPEASLLFTTSGVGHVGRAFWGAYAASKFAVEGLTQVLAAELENSAIRVNAINPGPTRTSMRSKAFPAEDPASLLPPEAIVPTYLYLLGPDGRELHGRCIDCQPRSAPVEPNRSA